MQHALRVDSGGGNTIRLMCGRRVGAATTTTAATQGATGVPPPAAVPTEGGDTLAAY